MALTIVAILGFVAKELRRAYQAYLSQKDPVAFIGWLDGLRVHLSGAEKAREGEETARIKKEDLRLICFDYLCT